MRITKRTVQIAVAGLICAGLAGVAIAQDGAAQVAARQKDMMDVQASMLAANDRTGKNDMAGAKAAAEKLDATFKDVATRFTPGSEPPTGRSRASLDIWKDQAGFKAKIDNAIAKADALVAATNGTDISAARIASGEVNALCADCHGKYRSGGAG